MKRKPSQFKDSKPIYPAGIASLALADPIKEILELKELSEIGKRWRANSSLEEWFPFTAEELEKLKADRVNLISALKNAVACLKVCADDSEEAGYPRQLLPGANSNLKPHENHPRITP